MEVVAEMIAIRFGLPKNVFTSLMHEGPYISTPSGYDLGTFGRRAMVLAACHYDFNFLTIQARSKFSDLNVWLKTDGRLKWQFLLGTSSFKLENKYSS